MVKFRSCRLVTFCVLAEVEQLLGDGLSRNGEGRGDEESGPDSQGFVVAGAGGVSRLCGMAGRLFLSHVPRPGCAGGKGCRTWLPSRLRAVGRGRMGPGRRRHLPGGRRFLRLRARRIRPAPLSRARPQPPRRRLRPRRRPALRRINDYLRTNAHILEGEVRQNDRVLILSTCIYNGYDRLALVARRPAET